MEYQLSWPYVAQDRDGGWYADCEGIMQDPDPNRTECEAMQWAIDRLAYKLGQARHGCKFLLCLLHQQDFDELTIQEMKRQMRFEGITEVLPDWTDSRIIRRYEQFMNALVDKSRCTPFYQERQA